MEKNGNDFTARDLVFAAVFYVVAIGLFVWWLF